MKADLPAREPEILKFWEDNTIYEKILDKNRGCPRFVLHDGPPYANGHIHLGTALNKILKDIVIKSKNMSGHLSEYVPGWDCHGLPIELQVEKELGDKKKSMSKADIRRACRAYAERFIGIQRDEFRRLGILGQWMDPYLTMSYGYEARIARELAAVVSTGIVYREKKPVSWCPSCATALAEAEVEYEDRTSPSIYVAFRFPGADQALPALKGEEVFVAVWTTTPWTIPANLAICLHPSRNYAAVKITAQSPPSGAVPFQGKVLILLEALVPKVLAALGVTGHRILETFTFDRVKGRRAVHPLTGRDSLLLSGEHVSHEEGTGCVHTAPGHGMEDYITGKAHGLEIYSPVDARGRFVPEVPLFGGKKVFDANPGVIAALAGRGALLGSASIAHSYPHCWRCKNPVIFRATEQWFISMDQKALRGAALNEIEQVRWIPPWGRNRIEGMISVRPDWCISRQRAWGVPIVAFYCVSCGKEVLDPAAMEAVAGGFESHGADLWFEKTPAELLPPGTRCPHCGSADLRKEEDILDVWFDSGVSHAAVLEPRGQWPADLYLEGSDQHRGWFHTSLLHSVATRGKAPYRAVLTHGFTVDGQGKKMSKSLGNFIAPQDIIKTHGAEPLRLWVSAEDYREDIRYSGEILTRLTEAYRKIRNTCRFLLGNISDFSPDADMAPRAALSELDRYLLHRLNRLIERVTRAYGEYEFHAVFHNLLNFCSVDLSALYFDVLKDCLYTSRKDSPERRAAQTVLYRALTDLTALMAPILSFTAEEVWRHIPGPAKAQSVFLTSFPRVRQEELDDALEARWATLLAVRAEVFKALETARKDRKTIGSSLEARVMLEAPPGIAALLAERQDILRSLFIVSQASVGGPLEGERTHSAEIPGLTIAVARAQGAKCARCWNYAATVGSDAGHPDICHRCASALGGSGS